MENWSPIMYQAMNATGIDQQPILNGYPSISLYFITFIVVGVYFMLNLVIGVTIDQVWNERRWLSMRCLSDDRCVA